ncbi:hypothetical protein Lfu02_79880 [Longispora fulva]|uniref:Uncharacterized protein n=1 Tax=Longispora fulva TaxID=619741 RepID=A0A8J7GKC4_9ACTN|nr:hypothetical protein [Longispora fulva]MBG6141129.1 hypothetical protein [Longispora fulva]GIG63616.1 hypothetical protein Lfu02_79880 [Longispora fulva]
MLPLATAEQLAARLQRDLDRATADQALAGASALIRAIARQRLDYAADDTVILVGGERVLTLPERPIDETVPLMVVELADWDGAADLVLVAGRDYVRTGDQLTRGWPAWYAGATRLQGWPYHRPRGIWAPRVRVTYSHGHLVIPDHIVALVLDVAQGYYLNPDGLRSRSIDDYSETYATETLGAPRVEAIRNQLAATGTRRGTFSIRG